MSTTEMTPGERDSLAQVGRSWWVLLFVGVVTVLLGLFTLFWTDKAINVIAVLFGIYLLVSGIFQIVAAFGNSQHKALLVISGLLSVVLAVYLFKAVHSDYSAEILALFVGIAWLFRGVIELVVGLQATTSEGRTWMIWGGVLLIVGAIVVFVWPSLAVTTLFVIAGIMLLILGLSEIVGAFQVKKLAGV
jgi:uncharacterized membrane protein HdeD (DUF308 family)